MTTVAATRLPLPSSLGELARALRGAVAAFSAQGIDVHSEVLHVCRGLSPRIAGLNALAAMGGFDSPENREEAILECYAYLRRSAENGDEGDYARTMERLRGLQRQEAGQLAEQALASRRLDVEAAKHVMATAAAMIARHDVPPAED